MTRSAHVDNGEWHLYTLQIYSTSKLWVIIAPLVTRLSRTFAPRSRAKEKTCLYIFDPTPIHLARNINFVCLVTRRQPRSHLHGLNSSLGTTRVPGETCYRTLTRPHDFVSEHASQHGPGTQVLAGDWQASQLLSYPYPILVSLSKLSPKFPDWRHRSRASIRTDVSSSFLSAHSHLFYFPSFSTPAMDGTRSPISTRFSTALAPWRSAVWQQWTSAH